MVWMLRGLLAALFIGYPFLVYFGLGILDIREVSLILLLLALIRVFSIFFAKASNRLKAPVIFTGVALAVVASASLLLEDAMALRLYPFLVNGFLFCLFAATLVYPPSIIERLARLMEPDLPEEGVRYTRKVTIVWSSFFAFNGAISLVTALIGDVKLWTVYNGFVAYILMGSIFVIEYIVRRQVRRRQVSP